jgi:ABC-type transport system involved in multi-copper enzyme maturation permease subunit
MGRAYAIALNAFREAVRDRVLFGVLGLALASLLFGTTLAWLSISEQVRVLVDHGVTTISWLANLTAVFLGASFLYKEVELRTLYVILAKPVARWQFVLGRYLGIVATGIVFIALTASALLALLAFVVAESGGVTGAPTWVDLLRSSRALRAATLAILLVVGTLVALLAARSARLARVRAALSGAGALVASLSLCAMIAALARTVAPDETAFVMLASLVVMLELSVTAALATLVSSFSTPFVTGALSLGFFLVGRSTGVILELKARQLPPEILRLIKVVPEVFPNLYLFVPSRSSLALTVGAPAVLAFIAELAAYALAYAALFIAAASLLFRKRDLT